MSQLRAVRQEEFLLILGRVSLLFQSDLQLIGRGPPTLETAICFIQFTDSNVNLIQNTSQTYSG